ncbi:MAG: hypothetical protein PHQ23_15030, partial [Candidatus Wallbacteria bacterium]|nr:hypothetical protein [Candidatus Wallbacteria bacterium]
MENKDGSHQVEDLKNKKVLKPKPVSDVQESVVSSEAKSAISGEMIFLYSQQKELIKDQIDLIWKKFALLLFGISCFVGFLTWVGLGKYEDLKASVDAQVRKATEEIRIDLDKRIASEIEHSKKSIEVFTIDFEKNYTKFSDQLKSIEVTARLKIDDYFQTDSVENLINTAAERYAQIYIDKRAKAYLDSELSKLTEDIELIRSKARYIDVFDRGMKLYTKAIRDSSYECYVDLLNQSKNHADKAMADVSTIFLNWIWDQYGVFALVEKEKDTLLDSDGVEYSKYTPEKLIDSIDTMKKNLMPMNIIRSNLHFMLYKMTDEVRTVGILERLREKISATMNMKHLAVYTSLVVHTYQGSNEHFPRLLFDKEYSIRILDSEIKKRLERIQKK